MDIQALAGSPLSILIFAIASIAVTRLLDAGLKDRLPKWLLPYVAMVVSVAGQMTLAFAAGQGWRQALLFGFASGAGSSWAYSAGAKKLPGVQSGGGGQ